MRILSSPAIPLRDRVRMACTMGAVTEGLVAMADAFRDTPADVVADLIRDAIADLLPGKPLGVDAG